MWLDVTWPVGGGEMRRVRDWLEVRERDRAEGLKRWQDVFQVGVGMLRIMHCGHIYEERVEC